MSLAAPSRAQKYAAIVASAPSDGAKRDAVVFKTEAHDSTVISMYAPTRTDHLMRVVLTSLRKSRVSDTRKCQRPDRWDRRVFNTTSGRRNGAQMTTRERASASVSAVSCEYFYVRSRFGSSTSIRNSSRLPRLWLLLLTCLNLLNAASAAHESGTPRRCGDGTWLVRKVSNAVAGIEIILGEESISSGPDGGSREPMVRVNSLASCTAPRKMAHTTGSTCVVVRDDDESRRRAIDFITRYAGLEDVSERVQVWTATLPPRMLVDATTNKRHAVYMLENHSASRDEFNAAGVTRILDAFTNGDRQHEEGADYKAVVLVGFDDSAFGTPAHTESSQRELTQRAHTERLIALPRSGTADVFILSRNVSITINDIERRRSALYRILCCTSVGRSRFRLSIDGKMCTVRSPSISPVRHLLRRVSRASCTTDFKFPYPDDITLEFSAEEREVFERYRSFYKGSYEDMLASKEEFDLSLRFDEGARIRATARFRGVSSFRDCKRRKSLTITLANGDQGFRLMPGSLSDKIFLISLCVDDRYVKTHLVLSMAKKLGLFPHTFRYVRLKLRTRGEQKFEQLGIYLLMDSPRSSLERSHKQLSVVVRRRFDPARLSNDMKAIPDVSTYGDLDHIAGRVLYERVVLASELCKGDVCLTSLDDSLDVTGYLRWLALMTWVESGDYVDELWLFASNESGRHRFKVHAWDPDDSFESCHHGGVDAIKDFAFLYCAEGAIDRVLLRNEAMLHRYIDNINYVLRYGLTEHELRGVVDYQEREIRRLMVKDTWSGLTELREIEPTVDTAGKAVQKIVGSLRYYENLANFRRRALLRDPDVYREWDGEGATTWTRNYFDAHVVVEHQVRSYNNVGQEILIRITFSGRPLALNVSFDPTVVYEGSTYVATGEFTLENFPPVRSNATAVVGEGEMTSTESAQSCVFATIRDEFIVFEPVCDNESALPITFALHHRFWHSFANTNSSRSISTHIH